VEAILELRRRAKEQRERGADGLASLFEQNAEKGEEHAAEYIGMMTMVGLAARRIRKKEGW
jgi:hypothetical protein